MIPYSRQNINREDINSVVKILKSDFLTQGPIVEKFEKKFKKLVKAKFAISANSASSALHLACLAIGVKKGDIVWTVPNTFAASANCAINCGAKIDFIDIDEFTFNLSVKQLETKLKKTKKKNLPKLIIPVHLGGQATEQKEIWKLSKKYKFKILEDASHSIGAKHFGEKVGSCKWSDITVFSFHPVKIITTAEGGIATTNNLDYAKKMEMFRTNGITKEKKNFINKDNLGPWYYEQQNLGFNYRMNEISAALGLSQIKRLNFFLTMRNSLAKIYWRELKEPFFRLQKILKHNYSSYHLVLVQFNLSKFRYSYKTIFEKLRKKKFYVNLHYMPLHTNPFFIKQGFRKNQFPISEKYGKCTLSLPVYPGLPKKKVFEICKLIKSFVK